MSNIPSKPARLCYGYINVVLREAVTINMYHTVKWKVAESEKLRTFHFPMSLRIQIITLHISSEYTIHKIISWQWNRENNRQNRKQKTTTFVVC